MKNFNDFKDLKKNIEDNLNDFSKSKRDSAIEKSQIRLLNEIFRDISLKYAPYGLEVDASMRNTKRKPNMWYIKQNGKLENNTDKRNTGYDSKIFDYSVTLYFKNKSCTLLFMLKGIKNGGGAQDNAFREVVQTSESVRKCKRNDVHFVFMIDGEYGEKKAALLKKSDKYGVVSRNNIKEYLDYFIASMMNRV